VQRLRSRQLTDIGVISLVSAALVVGITVFGLALSLLGAP
jgi:hypothetical protein